MSGFSDMGIAQIRIAFSPRVCHSEPKGEESAFATRKTRQSRKSATKPPVPIAKNGHAQSA
jgi:hypothetical protein